MPNELVDSQLLSQVKAKRDIWWETSEDVLSCADLDEAGLHHLCCEQDSDTANLDQGLDICFIT